MPLRHSALNDARENARCSYRSIYFSRGTSPRTVAFRFSFSSAGTLGNSAYSSSHPRSSHTTQLTARFLTSSKACETTTMSGRENSNAATRVQAVTQPSVGLADQRADPVLADDEPLLCRAFDGPDERCLSRVSVGSRRALYEDSPWTEPDPNRRSRGNKAGIRP